MTRVALLAALLFVPLANAHAPLPPPALAIEVTDFEPYAQPLGAPLTIALVTRVPRDPTMAPTWAQAIVDPATAEAELCARARRHRARPRGPPAAVSGHRFASGAARALTTNRHRASPRETHATSAPRAVGAACVRATAPHRKPSAR